MLAACYIAPMIATFVDVPLWVDLCADDCYIRFAAWAAVGVVVFGEFEYLLSSNLILFNLS